jgi:hypothetical protein
MLNVFPQAGSLRPARRCRGGWLARVSAAGVVGVVSTIGLVFVDAADASGQVKAPEDVRQLERRIRRQRAEHLQALRDLIDQLKAKLKTEIVRQINDLTKYRSLVDNFDPSPNLMVSELRLALRELAEGTPPRPSPDAPNPPAMRQGHPSAQAPLRVASDTLLPPIPDAEEKIPLVEDRNRTQPKDSPAVQLWNQIQARDSAIQTDTADLARARTLLRDLSDEAGPPPIVPGVSRREVQAGLTRQRR